WVLEWVERAEAERAARSGVKPSSGDAGEQAPAGADAGAEDAGRTPADDEAHAPARRTDGAPRAHAENGRAARAQPPPHAPDATVLTPGDVRDLKRLAIHKRQRPD